MPRAPPRLQYEGAIYHVVTRGDGRGNCFTTKDTMSVSPKGSLTKLTAAAGWSLLTAGCPITFTFYLERRSQTSPRMQHWLSGYANWYAKRNRRHRPPVPRTLQGVPGRGRGLLLEPQSLYPPQPMRRCQTFGGFTGTISLQQLRRLCRRARRSRRVDWVDYDQHHRYWHARNGGDPESAYRRFVKEGLTGQRTTRSTD